MPEENPGRHVSPRKTVTWDRVKLKRFEKVLAEAVDSAGGDSNASFTFDGDEYLVSYAKYLVEYLRSKLK